MHYTFWTLVKLNREKGYFYLLLFLAQTINYIFCYYILFDASINLVKSMYDEI